MPSDAQNITPSTLSGSMESSTTVQDQLQPPPHNSSITSNEPTLIPPLCSRPPERSCGEDNILKEISEIKINQPCTEIDGNTTAGLTKKTQQDFFKKLIKMEDNEIKNSSICNMDAANNFSIDSKEIIAGAPNSTIKDSDPTAIVTPVGI